MKWINRLYIIFVGILLAMTTGFGVAAFYPEPRYPIYPASKVAPIPEYCYSTPDAQKSEKCQTLYEEDRILRDKEQGEFDKKLRAYENANAGYTRTAVFLGVAVGSIFAIAGISMIKKSRLLTNGLMLGAVLTAVLTRLLIKLASFGSNVEGNEGVNTLSLVEFGFLVIITLAVIFVGFRNLQDENSK